MLTDEELYEKWSAIQKFSISKAELLQEKYRNNKGKDKKRYLLITGEDGLKRLHRIYNLKEVGCPRGTESWGEAITYTLLFYSILFDFKTANIDIYRFDELPDNLRESLSPNTICSSNFGKKLNELLSKK